MLDRLNTWLGRLASLSIIAVVLLTFLVVVFRYAFNLGSVAVQEFTLCLHAFALLGGMALTLRQDKHVRVDIFYRHFSPRTRAWINSLGAIVFLIPVCCFIFGSSLEYVARSWSMREGSSSGDGFQYVYLLRTCISGFCIALMLQALHEIGSGLSILSRHREHQREQHD